MLSLAAISWIDQIETCNSDSALSEPQRELMLIGMFFRLGEVLGGPVANCKGDILRVKVINPMMPEIGEDQELVRYTDDEPEEDDDETHPIDD